MKLDSLEYIDENDKQVIVIKDKNENLSPISLSILDSILDKKVTLIFSQGPLNLTPIISCLFAYLKNQDVLIGIPKSLFKDVFGTKITKGNYSKIYFSLLYRRKFPSSSRYFYYDMLWCNGKIDEEQNEMTELDIETYPTHGTLSRKRKYEETILERLNNGSFQNIPKIVSIPVDGITPAGLINEKEIKFDKIGYKLKKFDPKLIIYESINERQYSLDNITELIKTIKNSDRKLLLHFSWPYLKGLSAFLTTFKNDNNINVFHIGKRLCIETRKKIKKPVPNLIHLSLEGGIWDTVYYPKDVYLDFKIRLPASNIKIENLSVDDLKNWDWYFDTIIEDIWKHLKYETIGRFEDNILKFPPVINTFLCPSEIKRGVFLKKNKQWSSLPINESISINKGKDSPAIRAFNGLCSDIERFRDLSYKLRGFYTNSAITKKTLLQTYFIEKIIDIFERIHESNNKPNKIAQTSIIVANLYPHLIKTKTSFSDSLSYLFKSFKNIQNSLHILRTNNTVFIEYTPENGGKIKEIIFENGTIQKAGIYNVKQFISNNNPEINVSFSKKERHIEITEYVNLSADYIEFTKDTTIKKKNLKDLVTYKAVIKDSGSFHETKLINISFERKSSNLILNVKVEQRTDNHPKSIVENEIQIRYIELAKMQTLPYELIKSSELLIPGPIPFHTISDDDILISHGYDALLLPFKEIIFFAYPGRNFKELMKQIQLYKDIVSESETKISQRDLLFSIEHTNKSRHFELPPKPDVKDIIEDELDTPMDSAIRQEQLDESNANETEVEEIKTLKNIWAQTRNIANNMPQKRSFIHNPSKEYIIFDVKFEDGTTDTISFQKGILIRKKYGDDYILSSIDELSENDQIIYIQTDERDSIENYLLKTILSEDEMSLDDILKPLTALKDFYKVINTLDYTENYDEQNMKKLDWLSSDQKKNLYDIFSLLFIRELSSLAETLNDLICNSVWKGLIKPEKLIQIFGAGNKMITYSKLFNLAKRMGLNYTENSFKTLCSTAINDYKHYSFHDENNLLVIGRLIGHMGIIENYQIINDKGSRIGTFLRQVGRSINRVANGKGEFNEMDIAIEEKMKKCTIVKIGE